MYVRVRSCCLEYYPRDRSLFTIFNMEFQKLFQGCIVNEIIEVDFTITIFPCKGFASPKMRCHIEVQTWALSYFPWRVLFSSWCRVWVGSLIWNGGRGRTWIVHKQIYQNRKRRKGTQIWTSMLLLFQVVLHNVLQLVFLLSREI